MSKTKKIVIAVCAFVVVAIFATIAVIAATTSTASVAGRVRVNVGANDIALTATLTEATNGGTSFVNSITNKSVSFTAGGVRTGSISLYNGSGIELLNPAHTVVYTFSLTNDGAHNIEFTLEAPTLGTNITANYSINGAANTTSVASVTTVLTTSGASKTATFVITLSLTNPALSTAGDANGYSEYGWTFNFDYVA